MHVKLKGDNALITLDGETRPRVYHLDALPDELRQEFERKKVVKIKTGSSVREAERELIKATLLEVGGNKSKAAEVLGLGRKTLYRKLKEYNIE